MDDSIKICVKSRTDFFTQYYSVPEHMEAQVEEFKNEINLLAESCADSLEFESKFASSGLSEKFNALIAGCNPVAYKMTKEEKKVSRKAAWDMVKENKSEIAKDIISEAADTVYMELESDLIASRRKAMIEDGTYADYTKVTNRIEDAEAAVGFLGRLFGKNKK